MINKQMAKELVLAKDAYTIYSNLINACIMQAVADKKFHCDWYSPVMFNLTDGDVQEIGNYIDWLEDNGYKVTMQTFLPNKEFDNVRVKLHINWE